MYPKQRHANCVLSLSIHITRIGKSRILNNMVTLKNGSYNIKIRDLAGYLSFLILPPLSSLFRLHLVCSYFVKVQRTPGDRISQWNHAQATREMTSFTVVFPDFSHQRNASIKAQTRPQRVGSCMHFALPSFQLAFT